jgi:hypothetical protein
MNAAVRWYRGFEGGATASHATSKSRAQKVFDATQLPARLQERIEKAIRELESLCNVLDGVLEAALGESETRRGRAPI